MARRTLLIVCLAFLVGCTTFTMPYEPVTFTGSVEQTSSSPFAMSVQTTGGSGGSTTMLVPAGATGLLVPMEVGSDNELIFGANDQVQFANNFAAELSAHGVLGPRVEEETAAKVVLILVFNATEHFPSVQKYILAGRLSVIQGNEESICPFQIDSSEGQGFGARITTNAMEAQKRASRMLMSELFGCVQDFVAGSDGSAKNDDGAN